MTRNLCLGLALFSSTLMHSPSHAATDIIHEGRAIARIYIPGKASTPVTKQTPESPLALAARELNYHFQKMSGATLEIVATDDVQTISGPAIVLGASAVALGAVPEKKSESQEGFRLLTRNNQMLIGGQSDDAVLFGAYALLEKLGCDWVMPGVIGEIIPRRATVSLGTLDESSAPDFQFRNLNYPANAEIMQWLQRQRRGSYWPAPAQTLGHRWGRFIGKHKKEIDADPTMLALVKLPDGTFKRTGPQIETTHPRVIELWAQDIRDEFERNKWPKDKSVGFGIGPSDGHGNSVSPEALAAGSGKIDPLSGVNDETDAIILLGNRIFEKLGPEYSNLWLGFYSYSNHSNFPSRYTPHPRITVTFAPINYSRYHGVLDSNSKSQIYYKSTVEKWSEFSREQGNALIYRGYNFNLAEVMAPYSKVRIWGEELPYYLQQGVIGLHVESAPAWAIHGPHDYVFMKLAWDASQSWQRVLRTYCERSFGLGANAMQRYFLRQIERQHSAGHEAGSYHALSLLYDEQFIADSEADIAQALRSAKTSEDKTRIEYSAWGLESLKLYLAWHRAATNFDFSTAEKHYNGLLANYERVNAVNPHLMSSLMPRYLKRFVGASAAQSSEYSSAPYHMVEKLPDAMPTFFDPQSAGRVMELYRPEMRSRDWLKTRTYSTTWDAQGLAGYRHGAV